MVGCEDIIVHSVIYHQFNDLDLDIVPFRLEVDVDHHVGLVIGELPHEAISIWQRVTMVKERIYGIIRTRPA